MKSKKRFIADTYLVAPEARAQTCREWLTEMLDRDCFRQAPIIYRLWRLNQTLSLWFEFDDCILASLWVDYLLLESTMPELVKQNDTLECGHKLWQLHNAEYNHAIKQERMRTGSKEMPLDTLGDSPLSARLTELKPLLKAVLLSKMGLGIQEETEQRFYEYFARLYSYIATATYALEDESFGIALEVMSGRGNFEL